MKRIIVIYKSKTGFAKKYAQWIADALNCELKEANEMTADQLTSYDTVIYGGGVYASRINGIELILNNLSVLSGKKVIVFGTGLTEESKEYTETLLKANFTEVQQEQVQCFFLRGGYNPEKCGFFSKMILKLVSNQKAKEMGSSEKFGVALDFTAKSKIAPLVECAKEQ